MFDDLTLWINRGGDLWAAWAFDFLPTATFFAAILLLIVACGWRLPAPLRYALLLVAVARFLAPALAPLPLPLAWRPESPVVVAKHAPPTLPTAPLEKQTEPELVGQIALQPPGFAEPTTAADPPPVPVKLTKEAQPVAPAVAAARLSRLAWLLLAYLAGVAGVALWIGTQAFRLGRLASTSRLAGPELQQASSEVACQLGLRRHVAVRITEHALPPQSFGVWRPTVVLPASALDSLEPDELRLVLAHELGHHARWDPAAKWLQLLAAVVWWFHPLVWMLGRQIDRVREQCCDELVLARGRTSAADYCRMLVHLAEHALARPQRLAPTQAMHPLRERMQRLLRASLRPTAGLSRVGMAVIALVAVVVFAGPLRKSQQTSHRNTSSHPRPQPPSSRTPLRLPRPPSQLQVRTREAPLLSAAGVVLGPDGKPLPGARVCLRESYPIHSMDDLYDSTPRDVLAETTSDERGEFRFENVASRLYPSYPQLAAPWEVVATAPGHGLAFWHLSAAKENARAELRLKPEFVVRGRLVDLAGAPIANVQVEAARIDALGPRVEWNRDNPRAIELWRSQLALTSKTDADGRFELKGLPPGIRATLFTDHQDFQRKLFYVATSTLPQANVEDGRAEGRDEPTLQPVHTGDFLVSLEPGPRMEGRVFLGDTGAPVAGAKVDLSNNRMALYQRTDAEGRFAFHGLEFGTAQVKVHSPDSSRYLGLNLPAALDQADRATVVRAELPVGRILRGRVVDPDTDAGVAEVALDFSQARSDGSRYEFAGPIVSDAKGEFAAAVSTRKGTVFVQGPVPGYAVPHPHSSQARDAAYSQSFAAGDEPGPSLRIALPKGATLEGIVRDAEGHPVAGATVSLAKSLNRPDDLSPSAVSGADGKFRLTGVLAAKKLELNARLAPQRLLGTTTIAASERGVYGPIEIKVAQAGRVTGRVLSAGEPLAGAKVVLSRQRVEDTEKERFYHFVPIETTTTDADGYYVFPLVEPGEGLLASVQRPSFNRVGGEHFDLIPGQEKELVTISLNELNRSLVGIVVDPRGRPVEGAKVTASFANHRPFMRNDGVREVRSGADGRFELDELPNKPLEIMAYFNPPKGHTNIRFPARVEVAADAQEVRLVLDPKLSRPR